MSLKGNVANDYVLRGRLHELDTLRGYSAYEIALIRGFKGTEAEWLASLKGDSYILTEADKAEIAQAIEIEEETIGDLDAALDAILAIQESLTKVILTFILYSHGTCEFEEGMTWREWCESEYNTIGAVVGEYGNVPVGNEYINNSDAQQVSADERITPNETYYLLQ